MATFRTTGFLAKPRNPAYSVGKKFRTVPARAALLTAALANNDVVILGGPFTFDERIHQVFTPNATPALTSAADSKLGFFLQKSDGTFAVIKAGSDALLWTGATLASALSTRDLLGHFNAALDTTLNIGGVLGMTTDQEPAGGVYVGLTFPTKPSVDGVLNVDLIVEEATTN